MVSNEPGVKVKDEEKNSSCSLVGGIRFPKSDHEDKTFAQCKGSVQACRMCVEFRCIGNQCSSHSLLENKK